MPLSRQTRYIVALESVGYGRAPNSRSGRYYEMTYQGGATGIYRGDHKILIGSNGALRMTRGSHANSIVVNPTLAEQLLARVPESVREARKLFPESLILFKT